MRKYYTYAYLRENGTPYYVGRGCGRRVYENHKRRSGKFVPVPPRDRILILKSELTFEESVRHEAYMIAILGRKDLKTGILVNMSEGGEGNKGHKHSEETLLLMSKQRKGKKKSEEWKQKISQSHIGIGHSPESRALMSKIHTGKKWWVNKEGNTTYSFNPPDNSYIRGRKWKCNSTQ